MTTPPKNSSANPLASSRDEIDKIDSTILRLLNRRAKYALEVAHIKRQQDLPIHVPERERAIIQRLLSENEGPFPSEALQIVYREIISASLALEEPQKIAFFGSEGTFTHLAAVRHFGSSGHYIPCESFRAIFESVEAGDAHYGLVPIENSIDGAVTYTLDMFVDSELKIAAEVFLEVSQHLLSKSGDLTKVQRIFSFQPPAAQCRLWLETHMRGIPILDASSTVKAAEIAALHDDSAAIAGEMAARIHDLKFVRRNIQDRKDNTTRFLVISKHSPKKSGEDKTSIMYSVRDRPGALYDSLFPFKERNINLTKIESRPSKRRAWEYIFFVDMEGHIEDLKIQEAIQQVRESCLSFRHLGSYPVDNQFRSCE